MSAGADPNEIIPSLLTLPTGRRVRWYFELTVSPGFDSEIPLGMPQKECQDEGTIIRNFAGDPNLVFLGVFDGHGSQGLKASRYTVVHLPERIANHPQLLNNPQLAYMEACREVGAELLNQAVCGFDGTYSGTTACFAVLQGATTLVLGNVGDSRAIVARAQSNGTIMGVDLTHDDKPTDEPEKRRIEASGGRVAQQEYDPGEFDGPFRVFVRDKKIPGLAMSRSLGDGLAESVGVIPDPTCSNYQIRPDDKFLLLATDGLWEVFDTNEAAVWAHKYMSTPENMARMCVSQAIAEEAQRRWTRMDEDCVVDDTTVLIVRLRQK